MSQRWALIRGGDLYEEAFIYSNGSQGNSNKTIDNR